MRLWTTRWEYYRDETRQASDRAFFLQVQDAVAGVLTQERFDKHLLTMRKATGEALPVEDIQEVVEIVGRRFSLGEGERKSVLTHLIQGADLSLRAWERHHPRLHKTWKATIAYRA